MLEIEMKFPVSDFDDVQTRLKSLHAKKDDSAAEADHYFNAPDRDFAKTDEAFRLRRVGSRNTITYKGPKQAGPVKTRTELEVNLKAGAEAAETYCSIVQHLGYRPVAIVRKKRIQYHFKKSGYDLAVTLDEVETLGKYVEVEIVAADDDRFKAQDVIAQVVADLGLKGEEKRSYLELVLSKK